MISALFVVSSTKIQLTVNSRKLETLQEIFSYFGVTAIEEKRRKREYFRSGGSSLLCLLITRRGRRSVMKS